jgi:dTDP-4-amino-4,6-dideoxygalactose transaminase
LEYIQQAFANGTVSGDGPFTKCCSHMIEQITGARKALLTTSCTHALEMAAILADCTTGTEVILPSFTFVSSANAFVLRGAKPVFVDIRDDTLNLNEELIEERITHSTRAIVVVHYAGVACAMDKIAELASKYNLTLIEDNAHGLFGKYKNRPNGSLGTMATQSFHETKNISCGEGGALLLNDEQYFRRAEIIREKGTNRSRFFRGEVDKYSWVDIGSSYLPSDILAACLQAQLEYANQIQEHREKIWLTYQSDLESWAHQHDVRLPMVPEDCHQSFHMFYLICPTEEFRAKLITHLKTFSIHAVFHYLPLHLSEMGMRFGGGSGDCPIAEEISDQLLRLPMFYELSIEQVHGICDVIQKFTF